MCLLRLAPERRRTYCRLIIALCDGDLKTAAAELKAVGYSSNQSERAPERDAEFFEHIFRDANVRTLLLFAYFFTFGSGHFLSTFMMDINLQR